MLYDYVPKVVFMNTTIDAIFVIHALISLCVSYLMIRENTDLKGLLSIVVTGTLALSIMEVRGLVWQTLEYVLFRSFATQELVETFVYFHLIPSLLIMLYSYLKLKKWITLGRYTRITLIAISIYFMSWILLDLANFREPLTCVSASPDFMLIHFIIGKALFVLPIYTLFKDGVKD